MQTRRAMLRASGALIVALGAAPRALARGTSGWTPVWVSPMGDVHELQRTAPAQAIFNAVVRLEAGGARFRVRLSNRYGTHEARLSAVDIRVAPTGADPSPPATALRFANETAVVLEPGAVRLSDPIAFSAQDGQDIEVRLHYADACPIESAALSSHLAVAQSSESDPDRALPAEAGWPSTLMPLLEAVEAEGLADRHVVVCFGDSITSISYPTELSRLLQQAEPGRWIVLNEGIGGNRVLRPSPPPWRGMFGPSGIERFTRMIADFDHIDQIVLVQGTNDIALPGPAAPANEAVTAAQVIAGLNAMVDVATVNGIKVIRGTIMPFGGYPAGQPPLADFHERERVRQAINRSIRETTPPATLVDLDALMRDPANHRRLRPDYDVGDHVHPNAQGFAFLANAVFGAVAPQAAAADR